MDSEPSLEQSYDARLPEEADPRPSLNTDMDVKHVNSDEIPIDPAMEWSPTQPPTQGLDSTQDAEESAQPHVAMTTTTRRNANGSTSSVFSGNKIRYLKKDDGHPLWRKDIQYLFLRMVFEDDNKVFTKASDGTSGHTFADIYIDAMAKSSKCSQILKDKLLSDRTSAIHMAMICLLVNVGRMNTTLNFFPEMRARVRTYHAIPSLQAHQGSQAYKQLQDGPRLKSILKGAMEDRPQPSNIDDLWNHQGIPRTNPVNLIFVLSQFAPKVSETHFFPPRDFFDLFMRPNLSSRSRATAFLWLVWWYLESDFSPEDSERNPFGPGSPGEEGSPAVKVPPLEILSDEQAELENVDTEDEIAYGEAKRQEREAIVANDMPPTASGPKRGHKTPLMEQQHNYRFRFSPLSGSGSESGGRFSASPTRETSPDPHRDHPRQHRHYDGNRTQSPSPPPKRAIQTAGSRQTAQGVRIGTLLNNDELEPDSASPRSRSRKSGRRTRNKKDAAESIAHPSQLHTSLMPEQSSHHSSPHPHNQEALSGVGPPLLPSNSHNPYNDPQIPYTVDGQLSSPVGASGTPTIPQLAGNKRPRATATAEQTRKERVRRLLDEQVHEERAHKRHVRARRGALIDSWVKCSMLPEGWDSDEDELGKWAWGGFDEIVHPSSAQQVQKDDETGYGDVGDQARQLARGLRRVKSVLQDMMKPNPSSTRAGNRRTNRGGPIVQSALSSHNDDTLSPAISARPTRAGGILQADGTIDTTNQRPNKRAYRARPSAASRNAQQQADLAEGEPEEGHLGRYRPRVPNPSNTPNLELSVAPGRAAALKEGTRASGGSRRSGGGGNRSRRSEGTGGAASSSSRRRKPPQSKPVDPETGSAAAAEEGAGEAKPTKPPAKRASGGRTAPSSSRRRPASSRAKKAAAPAGDDVAPADKPDAEAEPAFESTRKDIPVVKGEQDEDVVMRDAEAMQPQSSPPPIRHEKEGPLDVDTPGAAPPAPDSPGKLSDETRIEVEDDDDDDARMDVIAERGAAVSASAEDETAPPAA